jgi:hypothetical protein
MKINRVLLTIVLVLTGCQKPSETHTYSSTNELSYRVDSYEGKGAASPSSTAVYAVLTTNEGRSEKLVLSGTYLDIKSISWQTENEGKICISGGYTETYRKIVALSVGSQTKAVYTHLTHVADPLRLCDS